ncbi:type II toxin-antitoxin system VapC family toxin [Ancylobacter sp. VNQ12]|uniref:type II toxin-antitoxin system VapC family toxin n=1 Tax=Ancylobacter sp. VNQ12 TaxID=3400920 RepID=UPI003C00213C
MSGTKPVIYLDSCIFISMLTGEQRGGSDSEIVAGLAVEIERKELIPVTSGITRVEVLECNLTKQQQEVLSRLLRPPKVQIKDVITPILDIAKNIREFYQELRASGETNLPTVETADAIHIATAIYFRCDALYTFDEVDRPNGGRPKRGMIPLSGTIADQYHMTICKPSVAALGLRL